MTNLRYALRSLRKSPGFVSIAVLALGIGLGLSTTMFAVLDTVLHPAVAYRDPDRLFTIFSRLGKNHGGMTQGDLYRLIRDRAHSFEAIAPTGWGAGATIDRAGQDPLEVDTRMVSPRWFALAGVAAWRGRALTAADADIGVMVSRDLWRRLFNDRRSLDNATLTVSGKTMTVVGIIPDGAGWGSIWRAMPPTIETTAGAGYVTPWIRLRRGVTMTEASRELSSIADELTGQYATRDSPFGINLSPVVFKQDEIHDTQKAMLGSALLVLIIACVNLAHLMLTRGLAKRRELALRMAVGASRSAIVRQMFTECAIITLCGAMVGVLVALWGSYVLEHKVPPEVSWIGLVKPQLSWRAFTLGGLAAAASAIAFGLVPALRVALGVNLDEPLKDDSGTTTGRVRSRYNPLVISEVALALVLMMGGALLLRTVRQLATEREDANEETLWQGYMYARADSIGAPRRSPTFTHSDLEALISATPGVRALALTSSRRTRGGALSSEMTQDSVRVINAQEYEVVAPDYLRVRALPILTGRDFEAGDAAGSGVAILDALAAKRLYPNQNPVGHMIKLGAPQASDARWVPIVGVSRSPVTLTGDTRYAPEPNVWIAMADTTAIPHFVLRTASPDPKIAATVQRRLRELPGVAVGLWPWNYGRKAELASRRFLANVFVGMGAVALGLAALGLYGVLAYTVTRRMREFAVRVALGAEPRGLRRMVLRDGFVVLLAGIGIGAFAALAASRYLDAILIAVLPSDVVSLLVSEFVLMGVGLAAALGPAARASRANPMDILRAT